MQQAFTMDENSEKQKIGFSLSERSFALYPPLENHPGAFPYMEAPACAPTPVTPTAINDLDAYPVKCAAQSRSLDLSVIIRAALFFPCLLC